MLNPCVPAGCAGNQTLPTGHSCNTCSMLSSVRSFVRLQVVLPPDILLPSRRLQVLVEQAMELQLMRCRYHNQPVPVFSLLSDYSCGPEQIPSVTTQVGRLGPRPLLQSQPCPCHGSPLLLNHTIGDPLSISQSADAHCGVWQAADPAPFSLAGPATVSLPVPCRCCKITQMRCGTSPSPMGAPCWPLRPGTTAPSSTRSTPSGGTSAASTASRHA